MDTVNPRRGGLLRAEAVSHRHSRRRVIVLTMIQTTAVRRGVRRTAAVWAKGGARSEDAEAEDAEVQAQMTEAEAEVEVE